MFYNKHKNIHLNINIILCHKRLFKQINYSNKRSDLEKLTKNYLHLIRYDFRLCLLRDSQNAITIGQISNSNLEEKFSPFINAYIYRDR